MTAWERPLDQPQNLENALARVPAVALLPTPRTSDMNGAGGHGHGGLDLRTTVALPPTPVAGDSERHSLEYGRGNKTLLGALLPTPTANEDSYRLNGDSQQSKCLSAPARRGELDEGRWGIYAPAIARWEATLGRPAPELTDEKRRLNPDFVCFMMGFPEGWLHGSRTQQLKQLGNAVVPQQGAYALRQLS